MLVEMFGGPAHGDKVDCGEVRILQLDPDIYGFRIKALIIDTDEEPQVEDALYEWVGANVAVYVR